MLGKQSPGKLQRSRKAQEGTERLREAQAGSRELQVLTALFGLFTALRCRVGPLKEPWLSILELLEANDYAD